MSKWPSRELVKETREAFVEAEYSAVTHAIAKLVPIVKQSGDEQLKRGFDTLLRFTLFERFKLEDYWVARHIGSGHRDPNPEHEKIRRCAARLLAVNPKRWGLARKVRNATGTNLSDRQINRILEKNGT